MSTGMLISYVVNVGINNRCLMFIRQC